MKCLHVIFLSREENDRLSHLHGDLHQLNQEGQAIASECDVNKRQLAALGAKIHRRLGEKKKLSIVVTKLRNAREEEEPEEDTATYVSHCLQIILFVIVFQSVYVIQSTIFKYCHLYCYN